MLLSSFLLLSAQGFFLPGMISFRPGVNILVRFFPMGSCDLKLSKGKNNLSESVHRKMSLMLGRNRYIVYWCNNHSQDVVLAR